MGKLLIVIWRAAATFPPALTGLYRSTIPSAHPGTWGTAARLPNSPGNQKPSPPSSACDGLVEHAKAAKAKKTAIRPARIFSRLGNIRPAIAVKKFNASNFVMTSPYSRKPNQRVAGMTPVLRLSFRFGRGVAFRTQARVPQFVCGGVKNFV